MFSFVRTDIFALKGRKNTRNEVKHAKQYMLCLILPTPKTRVTLGIRPV